MKYLKTNELMTQHPKLNLTGVNICKQRYLLCIKSFLSCNLYCLWFPKIENTDGFCLLQSAKGDDNDELFECCECDQN